VTGKPEILFLAHRIPYPPDKGDKIRSWRMLHHLTERFGVHLACFVDDKRDFAHTEFLSSLCASAVFVPLNPVTAKLRALSGLVSGAPLSFSYYRDQRMKEAVKAVRARPLVAEIAFSSTMAPYIENPALERIRIVDFCDADSEKWRQYATESKGPMRFVYAREAKSLGRAETRIANWADASFAITKAEAALFNARHGMSSGVDWWTNGVDAAYFDPAIFYAAIDHALDVAFVGAMDYRANIDAAQFFVTSVWPLVRARVPEATFAIIGANPHASIRALDGKDGVIITGRVDDVRPWLAQSKVIAAPLRIARGVQNKVLEAMAMAKPVVATSEAAAGVSCTPGEDILVADAPGDIAGDILLLLADKQRRQTIGAAARARIIAQYNWTETLKRFDAALPIAPDEEKRKTSVAG